MTVDFLIEVNYHLNALLVQLVERRFPKPSVEGSSPSGRALDIHRRNLLFTIFFSNAIIVT